MTAEHVLLALAVFALAGTVKGLVGLGLPTITIALTSLVLPLSDTIALVALPTIFTNLYQSGRKEFTAASAGSSGRSCGGNGR